MAMPSFISVEPPESQLTSRYSVSARETNEPVISTIFKQVVKVLDEQEYEVTYVVGNSVVRVTEWIGLPNLKGKLVWDNAGTFVGEIIDWDDENGDATFDGPVGETTSVWQFQASNVVNAPMYREAVGHSDLPIIVRGNSEEALLYIKQRMVSAFVEAGTILLSELGIEVPTEQVVAAVISLGERGVSIDTVMARQAEQIAADYQSGLLPFADEA